MTLNQKSQIALDTSRYAYLALLVLMFITSLPANQPGGPALWLVLSVKLIPLLIVLPGLLLNKLRSHVWLCFIILFYFTRAVVDAFLTEGAVIEIVISLATIILFIASTYHIKWERAMGRSL